jgi:hypothetical protein
MKRLFALLMLLLLILAACASTPETDTTTPLPEGEYTQAKDLKSRVDKYELGGFAPQEYQQAEQKLKEGETSYSKDNTSAKAALEASITAYNAVVSKGFPLLIDKKEKKVGDLRRQSEEIKAQVALKDDYQAAVAKYDQAVAAEKAGNYEQAVSLFGEAEKMFQEVYTKTKAKKDRAENAMDSSSRNIKDFEEKAKEGDAEIQGGTE